jgi:adenine phosphoribosyltransferase
VIIPKTVRLSIAGCHRELPVREVAPGVHLGILTLFGDSPLTEAAGCELARWVPKDVEVIVMPDGKAQTLAHVVQRELYESRLLLLPTILARKEPKSYMEDPVLETPAVSITTRKKHAFFLGDESVRQIRGRNVLILDDVVSSGGTIKAVQALLELAGARETFIMAVGTEGERRDDVIALTHFQVYFS